MSPKCEAMGSCVLCIYRRIIHHLIEKSVDLNLGGCADGSD